MDEADGLELAGLLATRELGRAHEHHRVLASTNDRALEWARAGAVHGALVTADEQTAGRGRQGRTWSAEPGRDVLASLILRPAIAPDRLGALGLATAVGIREGLVCACSGIEIDFKWPNDVMASGRKLAGILCESRWHAQGIEIVAGFGINVHRRDFAGGLADTATSLAVLGHAAPSRTRVLAHVLDALEDALDAFVAGGFAAIRARYEPHCIVLGRTITVSDAGPHGPAGRLIAVGLDPDGALRARPEHGGPSFRIEAADVWLSRS